MSRNLRQQLDPAVTVRRKASVINRAALEILQQNGAKYVAVIIRDGRLLLQPLEIPGLLKIAILAPMDHSRAHSSLGIAESTGKTARYLGRWNDAAGVMELDTAAPLKARKRRADVAAA